MEIDKKLKEARMNAGITQEQIAEKINVSRQTISNWENGKTLPDIISVIKMSDLYQISLDDLLKGDSKMLDKIEKDVNTVKSNRAMMNVGKVMLLFSIISTWSHYGGNHPLLQFTSAAAPWVMLGVGIACILASISNEKREKVSK